MSPVSKIQKEPKQCARSVPNGYIQNVQTLLTTVFPIWHILGKLQGHCKETEKLGYITSSFKMFLVSQFPYSDPAVSPKCAELGTLWSKGSVHSECTSSEHFRHTVLVLFEFYWLGTLWSHHWEHWKVHCKWATQEHWGYFLWGYSKCTHGLPNQDTAVTWPEKLGAHWGFSLNEPLRDIMGTFFGEIQNVPKDYLIRTSQSHDLGHCKWPEHSLGWEHCKETGWEHFECTYDGPGGFFLGTLSMSLQCIYNVLDQETGICAQCLEEDILGIDLPPFTGDKGWFADQVNVK